MRAPRPGSAIPAIAGALACAAVFAVVGAVVGAGPARAQSPAADWRTASTEHFRVHYPAESEA